MLRKMIIPLMTVVALSLAGCGGGGSDTQIHNTTVSKGQALVDLKKAYDSGAMSKSEYERERERILDQ